jgi:hypothetical protein
MLTLNVYANVMRLLPRKRGSAQSIWITRASTSTTPARIKPRRCTAFAVALPAAPARCKMVAPNEPAPQHLLFVNRAGRSRTLHHYPAGRLIWIKAPKTAFASALTRSGVQMASCTAKPISIGLRPSGKSWRHQRPRSHANRPRKRSDGRLHVRRPPERSRSPANTHSTARLHRPRTLLLGSRVDHCAEEVRAARRFLPMSCCLPPRAATSRPGHQNAWAARRRRVPGISNAGARRNRWWLSKP